jgi:outer membrane protein, heavy metal efflux system
MTSPPRMLAAGTLATLIALLPSAGCRVPSMHPDCLVCNSAVGPFDVLPTPADREKSPAPANTQGPNATPPAASGKTSTPDHSQATGATRPTTDDRASADASLASSALIRPVAAEQTPTLADAPGDTFSRPTADGELIPAPAEPQATPPPQPPRRSLADRIRIPEEIPGGKIRPLELPKDPQERQAAIDRHFPALPTLDANPGPGKSPTGAPLTLDDLQRLGRENNPLVRQAAADVAAAQGTLLQVGLYPNPNFGFQGDTIGTGSTGGYQGVFAEQTIKTGGKLVLARAQARMDLRNAELAYRRAETDLLTDVRNHYFAVLVAEKNLTISLALARLFDELYAVQVDQLRAGQAAHYEPLQLRVLALQNRGSLVQARNRYTAAWKQLAASLGLPAMPPAPLAGRVDMPLPRFRYDACLERVLTMHTDVLTASNTLERVNFALRLARVTPIPDVDVHVALQKDYTVAPFGTVHSLSIGVPVPIWDRNQGNISAARAALLRATEEQHRVRNDLTNQLATAFEQYENNRVLLDYYQNHILADQARATRGAYIRHLQEPDKVGFADVVVAEQALIGAVTTYVSTLGAAWAAAVSVADLLQTDDMFQYAEQQAVAPIPDLENMPGLPCCHPCSDLPDPALQGAHGTWPAAAPGAHAAAASSPPAQP